MKLTQHGKNISEPEIVGITMHGLWLHVNEVEYFLPFEEFPWFKEARLGEIQEIKLIRDHHLRWDKLDIDLELDSLKNLQNYPLKYQ